MSAELPVFVINLDRSPERWAEISARAADLGLELRRVPGVDGKAAPREDWLDVDFDSFARNHGRHTILPGEYGCHRSHLAALEAAEASGAAHALILEDDIALSAAGLEAVRAIAASGIAFDAVKLMNHRVKGFRPKFTIAAGGGEIPIGLALHGPLGSSSAYVVSRAGAGRLRRRLARLSLPYDVALERWWDGGGAPVYTSPRNLFDFVENSAASSSIGGISAYRATKLPNWRRLPTLAFRTQDYLRRAWGAATRQASPEA